MSQNPRRKHRKYRARKDGKKLSATQAGQIISPTLVPSKSVPMPKSQTTMDEQVKRQRQYVMSDVKRIATIAGAFFLVLIILRFVLG